MKSISMVLLLGGALVTATASAAAVQGDARRGQQAAAVCVSCHQANGGGMNMPQGESWPRLAGLDAGYLYKQLQDFKAGTRVNATMAPFANMLDDQQMRDVAVYYSQLPAPAPTPPSLTPAQAELGRKLVQRGDWDRYIPACNSCHGPNAQGVGASFPALAGQQPGYIKQQLLAWQQGARHNDPLNLMLAVAERMTEADIEAVSLWLAHQPAQ